MTDTALAFNNGFEFTDGVHEAIEWEYDENGNLTKDLNKNITAIQYNCLNLPSRRSEERRVGKECRSRWSPYH